MLKYEHDFIYKIIPDLTNAIENLSKELKRYNDNMEEEKKCSKETEQQQSQ